MSLQVPDPSGLITASITAEKLFHSRVMFVFHVAQPAVFLGVVITTNFAEKIPDSCQKKTSCRAPCYLYNKQLRSDQFYTVVLTYPGFIGHVVSITASQRM